MTDRKYAMTLDFKNDSTGNDCTPVRLEHLSEISEILSYSHLICDEWDTISIMLLKLKPLDIFKSISCLIQKDKENFEKIFNTLVLWRKQREDCANLEEILQIVDNYCKSTHDELMKFSQNLKSRLELKTKISKKEFWNVPVRKEYFVGNEIILKNLAEELNNEKVKISKSNLQIALIGLSGIGKSSIAIEFIYQNIDKFSHIFWFEYSVKYLLKKQFSDLSIKFNDENPVDQNDSQNLLKAWFEKSSKWLMVFNNVNEYENIKEFLPKFGGTILITTSKNQENWPNFTKVPVESLTFDELYNLIDKILKIPNFKEYRILTQNFEFCPFALVQSCHYIKNDTLNISEYLQTYTNYSKDTLKPESTELEFSNILVCKITMDKIKELNPLAYEWLQICSFSYNQGIPQIYLKEFLKFRNKPQIELSDIEKLLLKYNLISVYRIGFRLYYSVHPIIQSSVKGFIENELEILEICDLIIRSSIDYSEVEEKNDMLYYANNFLLNVMSIYNTVIVHTDKGNLENDSKLQSINKIISNLINTLFKQFGDECIEKFSELYFDQEIFIMNEMNNEYNMSFNLAEGFYEKSRNSEKGHSLKKRHLERALMFYKKNLNIAVKVDKFGREIGYIQGRIGLIYFDLENFDRARFYFEKSFGQINENEHPLGQIDLRIKLGQVYEKIHIEDTLNKISVQYESAIQLYLSIFQDFNLENIFEKIISSHGHVQNFFENWNDNYKNVKILDFLGHFSLFDGKFSEARKYFEMTAKIMIKCDADFVNLIRINYFLGLCEMKLLNYNKSINFFKKAIHLIEKISKPEFVHKIGDSSEIHLFYQRQKIENSNQLYCDLKKSNVWPLYETDSTFLFDLRLNMIAKLKCENIDFDFSQYFQRNLANVVDKLNSYKGQIYFYYYNFVISTYYFVTNDPMKALEYIEKSIGFCKVKNFKNFGFKASSLRLFKGMCLFELGRYEESQCEIVEVLKFCKQNHLNFHYRNAQGFYELGRILMKKCEYPAALENFRKSLVIFNQCSSTEDNVYSAIVEKYIGSCYYVLEKKFDAYRLFKKSFKVQQDDIKYIETLRKAETAHCLASCYFDMKDFVKANFYYKKALEIYENILGPRNIKSYYTKEFIGRCLYNLGDYEKSLEFLKFALEIFEKSESTYDINLSSAIFYISYNLDKMDQKEDSKAFFLKAVDYRKSQILNVKELLEEIEMIITSMSKIKSHDVDKVWSNFTKVLDEVTNSNLWNVGLRNEHFTGRFKILENLQNHLESKTWENSTLKIVLYGMCGIGKTSIVTEFLYRYQEKISKIFWFEAGKIVNLVKQICELAKELEYGDNDHLDSKNKMEFAKNFMKNLFDKKSGWLIVYDNVEDFEDIRNFIPRLGGILLATSRNTTAWSDFNKISVDCFEKSESCHLIQKILKIENHDDGQIEVLSSDLGDLPLVISNTCHYIIAKKIKFSENINYSRLAEKEILKFRHRTKNSSLKFGNFKEKSIWKSVKISLDKIKEECPLGFEFLQIISFLKADEIPNLILEEFIEFKKIDKTQINMIEKIILKYDLVKLEIRGEQQLYSIHRLVQKIIKLNVENEYQILLNCSEIIKNVCLKYTALDTMYILHHATHVLLYLIEFVHKKGNLEDMTKLLSLNHTIFDFITNNSVLYNWLSEIQDLDKIFSKYFETMENIIVESKDIVELHMAMAECFAAKKDFQNSLKIYEKLLVINRKIFGEISNETSIVYTFLGRCFYNLNDSGKSLEFLKLALEMYVKLDQSSYLGIDINLYSVVFYISCNLFKMDLKEDSKAFFQKAVDYKNSQNINVKELLEEIKIITTSLEKTKLPIEDKVKENFSKRIETLLSKNFPNYNLENILRVHWYFLCERTINISALLCELYSKGILSHEEIEMIKNPFRNATQMKTYECLYSTLVRKNLSPEILKNILLKTSNEHIVDKIWSNYDTFKFWNVKSRNDHFTGRCKILEILENHLESKMWENSSLKIVLCGMGGVGKTSIVTEFLYRNRKKFSNIFWFGAENKMNLVKQICQLAKELQLDNTLHIDSDNRFKFAKKFIENWFGKNSNWLIVYDNAEDFEDIQNFIPRLGGIVLVTSRNSTDWFEFNEIFVDCFERSESCNFIQNILKIKNDDNLQFEELSKDVGYLPLAISNICYFIKGNKITIKEYLNYSKEAEEDFFKICSHFEEKSVWKSVKISLDKIKEECPLAFEFLQIISFLQADELPKLILKEFVEFKKIDKMQIIGIQKFILKYDLVRLEIRGEQQLYSIHRLVQKIIKLNVENEYQILLNCSEIIKNVCLKYTALDTMYILHHATHVLLYLIEFVHKKGNLEDMTKLLTLNHTIFDFITNNSILYNWLSEIQDLDKIFSKYFETMEKNFVDSRGIYELNYAMAECFVAKKDFQNAVKMYEKLLVFCQEKFGEFSDEISKVYNNIGVCCAELNQFDNAAEHLEKSLDIDNKLYGIDSDRSILKYNNLGYISARSKDYKKAQKFLIKGLNQVHVYQMVNSVFATLILTNLGKVSFFLGELENFREYFEKCMKVLKQLYGEKSFKILNELKYNGDYFLKLNPSFALEFYQKLADQETKFHNGPSKDTLDKIRICDKEITMML